MELSTLPGKILDGKYQIDRLLGRGGMGAVYRAVHGGTSRTVAIKVIVPGVASGRDFLERFRREATAAGQMRHPNVVDVTDFGVALLDGDEVAYLVMEYLDGCDLSDVLEEEERLPVEWAVDIIDQVASAMDEAHRRGIVHRDLKPQNIWLEPNRRGGHTVKVLDFGIAKLEEGADPLPRRAAPSSTATMGEAHHTHVSGALPPLSITEMPTLPLDGGLETIATGSSGDTGRSALETPAERRSRKLTFAGAVIGTPAYMSPEQCVGGAVDARSDIYSLGVIAYEVLAGRRPFTGGTSAVMEQHVSSEPPDIQELCPDLPRAACDVVMWALAKDPEARPATASIFASALRANAEPTRQLFLRSIALCLSHAKTFLTLFLVAFFPFYFARSVYYAAAAFTPSGSLRALLVPLGLASMFAAFVSAALGRGISAVLISEVVVAPMRRLRLRLAFGLLRTRIREFLIAGTAFLFLNAAPVALVVVGAVLTLATVGLWYSGWAANPTFTLAAAAGSLALTVLAVWLTMRYLVRTALLPIVVLVENLGVRASLRRAAELSLRVRSTLATLALLQLLSVAVSNGVAHALKWAPQYLSSRAIAHWPALEFGSNMAAVLLDAAVAPFFAIGYAVLYLKARQAGGETLAEIADQPFITQEMPRTRWQQRMLKTPT